MLNIRFKRGNTADNELYVGGRGSLTIDSESLALRVHDGETPGGHLLEVGEGLASLQGQIESLGLEDVDGLVTALAGLVAVSELGQALGVTQLNPEGVIPTEQLPSWVEEILEADDVESLPETGEIGKLYIVKDTNELHRWSGSQERYYRITSEVDSSDDLSQGQINFFYSDSAVRGSLSATGDLSYDSETGVLSYSRSVASVQSQTGDVALGKADVGLHHVENFSVATEPEMAEAVEDSRYVTPVLSRSFAEAMGFVDTESGWTAEPSPLPPLGPKGIWTQLADGITAVRNHSATVIDGKMYVYGGHTGSSIIGSLQIYDIEMDLWYSGAFNRSSHFHSSGSLGNSIYVKHSGANTGISRYDVAEDKWVVLDNSSLAGTITTTTAGGIIDREFIIVGNLHSQGLFRYDIDERRYIQGTQAPRAHYNGVNSVVIDGRLYVLGGASAGGAERLSIYDPVADAWEVIDNLPYSFTYHAMAALDGKVYVYGGDSQTSSSNLLISYDPSNSEWEEIGPGPGHFEGPSLSAWDGKLFLYGGHSDGGHQKALYVIE